MENIIKMSDIESCIERKIIIENGVPRWASKEINGEIIFYDFTNEILRNVNDNVIQKLKGNETDDEFVFYFIPYVTNIEVDIPYDRFVKLMNSTNPIITMLGSGILKSTKEFYDFVGKQKEMKEFVDTLSKDIKPETLQEAYQRVEKEFQNEKDTKKKPILLMELARLQEAINKEEKNKEK